MKIISCAITKGGTGKTTTAVNLAYELSQLEKNTLVVDLDHQGNCSLLLGVDQEESVFELFVNRSPSQNVVHRTTRDQLYIVRGNSRTGTATNMLQYERTSMAEMEMVLREVASGFDYVVIDTHPSGLFQELSMYVADLMIAPMALDALNLDAIQNTMALYEAQRSASGRPVGDRLVLPTIAQMHTSEAQYSLNQLVQAYGSIVHEPIPMRAKAREAAGYGLAISEYAPSCDTAKAYRQLAVKIAEVQHG